MKQWTDDRVEMLRQRWREGLTALEISVEMGLSRNAVMGKVSRLHLEKRLARPRPPKEIDMAAGRKKRREPKAARPPIPHIAPVEGPAVSHVIEPGSYPWRTTLFGLKPNSCRWPIGDPLQPDFFFCGAPARRGHVYCACHAAMSIQIRIRLPRPLEKVA